MFHDKITPYQYESMRNLYSSFAFTKSIAAIDNT